MATVHQIKRYLQKLINDKNDKIDEKIKKDKKIQEWKKDRNDLEKMRDKIYSKIEKREEKIKKNQKYTNWKQEKNILSQFEIDYIKQKMTKDEDAMKQLIEKYEKILR